MVSNRTNIKMKVLKQKKNNYLKVKADLSFVFILLWKTQGT